MRIGGKTLEKRTTNGLRKRTHELLFIGWLIVCEHLNCWNQKELDVVISTSQQHFPHWFVEQDQLRIVDNVSERGVGEISGCLTFFVQTGPIH